MEIRDVTRFAIDDASRVAEVRRRAVALAESLQFSTTVTERAAIIAKELVGNILKHAQCGELLLRAGHQQGAGTLEFLALDRGPGIADMHKAMRDGFSTAGSPGTGLGAMSRLASTFDVYSAPGKGTAMMVQVRAGTPQPEPFTISAISLPRADETACGDDWAAQQGPDRLRLLVADGLGHGPLAATAANEATRIFRANDGLAPVPLLERVHETLRPTRGAAVAVAEVDLARACVGFAGVGNIVGVVYGERVHRMVSHAGTAGHHITQLRQFEYRWTADSVMILHSDGLLTRWSTDAYPGLLARHPSLIAGVLYRDFTRGRDDVTVVVAKQTRRC